MRFRHAPRWHRLLRLIGLGLVGMALVPSALAQSRSALDCAALPPRPAMPREAVPAYLEDPNWRGRVAELSRQTARDLSQVQLVFLGDSITQGWFPFFWDHFYGHRAALNLGVNGDFTQGMLWRLQQGGHWPATLRPKLVVLLIGTNNTQYGPPDDTALGIAEILRFIRQRSPATRILLVGVLPRGADATEPARRLNQRVNELVARCADNRTIFFTDPGGLLLDGQGRLSDQVAFDLLHLTGYGYALLGAGLEPSIRQLLGR
ncbi:GDSL-type esterase/lipase family protein [Roseomonas harenae]|uniref:GDSL-type esterase/lipase family protein n=1 Tax=Muricoccus harenae TaxID=2692566 RepID=UPI001F23A4DC|nr:GDSL-type esterase/lipase family protein [Roseomonas harenae]